MKTRMPKRLPPRRIPMRGSASEPVELKQPRKPAPQRTRSRPRRSSLRRRRPTMPAKAIEKHRRGGRCRRQRRGRQPRRLPQEELSPFHSLNSRRCRRRLACALRQAHRQPAPWPQGDALHGHDLVPLDEIEPHGARRWSPARSRPPAARSSRRCRPAGRRRTADRRSGRSPPRSLRQETLGQEGVGLVPEPSCGDGGHRARSSTIEPAGISRSPIRSSAMRRPAHVGHRRIEPHRLVDDGPRVDEPLQMLRLDRPLAEHLVYFLPRPRSRGPLVLRQQVERPGQGVRRRLVAGADEGHDVGPHLDVGQALPGLRIGRLEEQRQEIARRRARRWRAAPCGPSISSPTTSSKKRIAGRARRRPIRGTQSGKPKMSSGSSGPSASK